MAGVESEIFELISTKFNLPTENISSESSLTDELEMSSLDVVELLMTIEETFEIEISDEAAKTINTIKDMVFIVEKLMLNKEMEHVQLRK